MKCRFNELEIHETTCLKELLKDIKEMISVIFSAENKIKYWKKKRQSYAKKLFTELNSL